MATNPATILIHSSRNSSLPRNLPSTSRPSPTSFDMNRNKTLLGSVKNKFSSKEKSDSAAAMSSRNPFGTSQPTRRPEPGQNTYAPPEGPPPAYTPSPTSPQPSSSVRSNDTVNNTAARPIHSSNAPAGMSTNIAAPAAATSEADDPYSFLSTFDTIFLIDDSGSMAGRSWRECSQTLEAIVPIVVKHDHDGIDIHFLNTPAQPYFKNVTEGSTVHEIFSTVRPSGGTPTGQRLNTILKQYLREYEANPEGTKPLNVIVITDGVPSDDVESVLINCAKKLDRFDAEPWQVGVQFFQTGEEEGAAEHLAGLDDELARMGGGCRDIVDTVPFQKGPNGRGIGLTGEGILKVVLGAVNKRLDRRSNATLS